MIRRPVAKRQLSIEESFLQSAKKSPNESESDTQPKTNAHGTTTATNRPASNAPPSLNPSFGSFTWKNLHLLPVNEVEDVGGNEAGDVCLYETGHDWDGMPQPTPAVFVDAWDKDHVKMPCSPRSLYVENVRAFIIFLFFLKFVKISIVNIKR
ncbi:unnamed protein product [Dibothriocephalus latus]|uniref:Uncharacterized protein n=1 Tax=Dibothriocephalus latus TaxID=60516 RepID=A0A3P7LB39_DIBLA|nr:unnamed protein product [Dibothriocephalus latus]